MRVPSTNLYAPGERKQRTFSTSRDSNSPRTNLNITRSNHVGYNSNNTNKHYNNSSNVSSNKGSSSSSSSSSGGRRATRRN